MLRFNEPLRFIWVSQLSDSMVRGSESRGMGKGNRSDQQKFSFSAPPHTALPYLISLDSFACAHHSVFLLPFHQKADPLELSHLDFSNRSFLLETSQFEVVMDDWLLCASVPVVVL